MKSKEEYDVIKCSCGFEAPTSWVQEGKMGIRLVEDNGERYIEKYCVKCASEEEYSSLVDEFGDYIKADS